MLDRFFEIKDVTGATYFLNIDQIAGVEQALSQGTIRIHTLMTEKPSLLVTMSLEEFKRHVNPSNYYEAGIRSI